MLPLVTTTSCVGTVLDPQEQLVRHFLIETGPRGVKIKGCQNEPYFGRSTRLLWRSEPVNKSDQTTRWDGPVVLVTTGSSPSSSKALGLSACT